MSFKSLTILTTIFLFIAFIINVNAYPNGVSGYTLKTNASGCGSCHSTHSSASSFVLVNISGPATLLPNETGSYSVTISGGAGENVGVDIASSLGTLNKFDNNLKLSSGELVHTSPKSYSSGQYVFNFEYTAPATAGDQIIYATGMGKKQEWNFASNFTVSVTDPFIEAPTALSAIFASEPERRIELNWTDNSDNEDNFIIDQKIGISGSFIQYATVGANTTSFFDTLNIQDTTNYFYRVYASNTETVSDYSNVAEVLTPIPVELTSFTVQLLGNEILLNWSTATETNNAGFEIYHSLKNDNSDWKMIGFVEGNGSTTEPEVYAYNYKSQTSGKQFFQLKQMDYNGSFDFSNIVEINSIAPERFVLEQNYPNPFNPSTIINFSIPVETQVALEIFDVIGNSVATLIDENLLAGNHVVTFDASKLSSGIYFYKLTTQYFSTLKKMLLVK